MWLEIISKDGFHGFTDEETNTWRAFAHNNTLHQGWLPIGIWRVARDFSLVELRNGSQAATWVMGSDLQNLGDAQNVVPSEVFDPYRSYFLPLLKMAKQTTSYPPSATDFGRLAPFFRLNQQTRRLLAHHCGTNGTRTVIRVAEGNKASSLPHLCEMLSANFFEGVKRGIQQKAVSLIDPVNGEELLLTKSIPLASFRFALPFVAADGRTFYLCVADYIHCCRVIGLYDPASRELLVLSDGEASIAAHIFSNIEYDFEIAGAELGDVLEPYLKSEPEGLAAYLRPPIANHMGHQLWNELSGLQLLANNCRRDFLPPIIVPEAQRGTEIFGPTEELFPEFNSKIIRQSGQEDYRRTALKNSLTLLRFSDDFVSRELRVRIAIRVTTNAALANERARLEIFRKDNRKIILLGLRVENRTLIDLDKFCLDFLELCEKDFPGCVIVLDGHNSQGGEGEKSIIHSHGQWSARRAPIDVEREIVLAMQDRAQHSSVHIISTIGQTIDHSLFWSLNADRFITIWGAGLAKYRWVANRPGLVISSRWNLTYRADLRIYSSERYMEDPEEIDFADPALFADDLTAEPLMKFPTDQSHESYANFRLSSDLSFIRDYLKKSFEQ
ncbi:hypothetical protein [Rhizobium terrae]|uniref:hypothetical protein n=1 Tax=Rhizobium terrae TaxID=2171756 RepID=UPI000E3C3C22|nr:hypothetical protein [Rhizobium terrae]